MPYDLKPMKAPRAAGGMLRVLVAAIENPATGALLADKLLGDSGVTGLRQLPAEGPPSSRPPVFDHDLPRASLDRPAPDLQALLETLPEPPAAEFWPETSRAFVGAYQAGRLTPLDVAQRTIEIVRRSDERRPAMRVLIAHHRDDLMAQAQASAERYRAGSPLGPLDGVPVAVKDELDQTPYPTTVGTRFLGKAPASADAEVVARLRAAGALLVGKANMHEIGIGVTGLNPHHGAARNPYDPTRAPGGSSSGSAAAVAMGLCPIAVGADGGGSIRIPAALCGQVGLKATFGRISEHGAAELCWSVAHVGPIAATVADTALAYAVMAGPDDKDASSLLQPEPELTGIDEGDLSGLRLGIYRPWFEDAETAVVERCYQAVDRLVEAGAEIRDVTIDELEVVRVAHMVTIVSEMTTAHLAHYREHRRDYGLDTRINLALGRRLQAYDYVQAQRHRARMWRNFARVLSDVDVIVTPTTGRTAPELPEDALRTGESNLEVLGEIMRFAAAANLTGLPAISVPVGYDEGARPIGLQLMGRAWQEHLLLRLAAVVERGTPRREPEVCYRYLADGQS
ncbi:MAG: amidase [Deltaproteobacteria bacterium]|nr:amidase [Deltaproteobacteria bacterium]